MAFDYSTAIDYTTAISMVKTMSLLVSTQTDPNIRAALETQAVPRIAGYLMTAQDTKGNYIFYTALGDLTDNVIADKVEQLVAAVMSEPLVAGYIRRIAAALACAYLLTGGAGSFIASQESTSVRLENQAMADLKHLIKTDLISKSIDSALPKITLPGAASIYFALDMDPSTNEAYTGAQDSGTIIATINGFSISSAIDAGDTPVIILNKIASAINSAQGSGTINITAGPNDGAEVGIVKTTEITDPFGATRNSSVTYRTNVGSLSIYPYKYDKIVDVATVTIQLINSSGELGIPGIIYGTSSKPEDLTQSGPYSIAIDLDTGKTTSLDDPNKAIVSESLFFLSDDPTFGTLSDGTFKYRINGGAIQTVDIPSGSLLHKAVELLAQDLANKSLDQRLLGAVRPATKLTINGTPATAPGLTLVSVGLDKLYAKFVFTLLSSPSGIRFGVVPSTLVTQSNFDELTKSVVVTTNIGTGATYSQTQPDGASSLGKTGNTYVATHKPSPRLKRILDLIEDPNGPLDPNGPPS